MQQEPAAHSGITDIAGIPLTPLDKWRTILSSSCLHLWFAMGWHDVLDIVMFFLPLAQQYRGFDHLLLIWLPFTQHHTMILNILWALLPAKTKLTSGYILPWFKVNLEPENPLLAFLYRHSNVRLVFKPDEVHFRLEIKVFQYTVMIWWNLSNTITTARSFSLYPLIHLSAWTMAGLGRALSLLAFESWKVKSPRSKQWNPKKGKNKNKGIKDITNTSDDESLPLPCQTSQTALVTGTAGRAISRWALKVRQLPGYLIQARKRFQVNYKTLPYEHQACRPEALVNPLTNRGRPHETSSQGLPIFQQDQESSAGGTIASEWNT
ncbi:hypothetical protein AU210_012255 [Fusarium oxysporum f. sp. radicis-cucumerinum]|uniref:Uncharacterized protein n=1 Tax=Fusarium oxysporum f. sp. radicis-cucumerinum TaxID=327505 RepID=A0A2H3G7U8_FUSOX|nr:hypothetical protein AU210_012255 [Fusarium oxysporum f. sp. radicis-cucumerinum]